MKKKDNVVRVGDIVQIVEPEFFIRCGYPLSFQDAYEIVKEKYTDSVHKFLVETEFRQERTNHLGFPILSLDPPSKDWTIQKILKALTYEYVANKGFGGEDKKIYTERREECIGKKYKVKEKRVVKTGTYYPSFGYYDSWTGEYDGECGGLAGGGTHIILTIAPVMGQDNSVYVYADYSDLQQIERIHVEKINRNNVN